MTLNLSEISDQWLADRKNKLSESLSGILHSLREWLEYSMLLLNASISKPLILLFIPDKHRCLLNCCIAYQLTHKKIFSYSGVKSFKHSLKVYDVLGREIATLANEERPAGKHEVNLDASQLASGVYFYRIQAGSFSSTKKLIMHK